MTGTYAFAAAVTAALVLLAARHVGAAAAGFVWLVAALQGCS